MWPGRALGSVLMFREEGMSCLTTVCTVEEMIRRSEIIRPVLGTRRNAAGSRANEAPEYPTETRVSSHLYSSSVFVHTVQKQEISERSIEEFILRSSLLSL
jgi:hypothetical protein